MAKKVRWQLLYQTYSFTKGLSFSTCEMLFFQSGKISVWEKLSDKSLRRIESKNDFS